MNSSSANSSLTSPHARVQGVELGDARWTRGLWAQWFARCRHHIVPHLWDMMQGTDPTHYLQNFRIAGGLETGRHRGAPFNDGDFYKWLEAASALLAVAPDDEWEARLEEIIGIIAQAQREDGYLHTKVLIAQMNGTPDLCEWQEPTDFEMYNMGHLLTAACVHHAITGRDSLLQVARRTADFLDAAFQNPTPQMIRCSTCPSHYMGLVDLYRATGEARYLALANRLIALRDLISIGDDNQDRIPFREQREAAGHAVRANYLYAGATDVFLETGDQTLWQPLESIWADIVSRKLYVTGGCGALYDGASPDAAREQTTITRVHQAYGRAYQLPNQTAHNETCAAIGSVLWNWRMFRATGQARFIEVLEGTLLNAVLVGATLDGTLYSYTNPLRFLDQQPAPLRYGANRSAFNSSFCCPPNLARTLAQAHGYAYATSENAVWVNLYGGSTLQTEIAGGWLKLTQDTNYPWDGQVRLTMDECPPSPFSLKLRIPDWAKSASLRLNSEAMAGVQPGDYFEIRRVWQAGDVVELEMPMPPQLVEAHPLVEEAIGQAAIRRGPMIYCLESCDLPPGMRVTDVRLPANVELTSRFEPDLLGGAVVLEGQAVAQATGAWDGQLYRELSSERSQTFAARFIPYALWGNRGESEMSVWLQLAAAGSARASALRLSPIHYEE